MKRYLLNEMKRYLSLVPDASEDEISDLKKWVAEGNSPYANPWYIADERGTELPFIEARRDVFILLEELDKIFGIAWALPPNPRSLSLLFPGE